MNFRTLFFCLAPLLVLSCSASKQAFKEAREYEDKGLYVEAAEADLRALAKDARFADAKVHLRKVAPLAYHELLSQAENLEAAENWDAAVNQYMQLNHFLKRCHSNDVVFETVKVKSRIENAKGRAAQTHYANAEKFFSGKSWGKAANAYLKAHTHVDNYNGSLDKAIQSLFNDGDKHLEAGFFDRAAKAYSKVFEVAANHPVAKRKMAETYYLQGKKLFDEGQFRKSLESFENVEAYAVGFRDTEEWLERAYRAAVQYVAVFPFLNNTEVVVDGYLIANNILNGLVHANLPFAEFLPHPETISLMSKGQLTRRGFNNESELLAIANEEGLDSIVWGVVREMDVRDQPERMQEIAYDKIIVVKDSLGRDTETTETIYYREYHLRRFVRVRAESMILEVETGATLDRQRYHQDLTDVARWIGYTGSIYDLPEDKHHLLDAPRNPRPVPVLVNELLARITEQIGRDTARFYE